MKIFVCIPLADSQLARLRAMQGVDVVYRPETDDSAKVALDDCEVAFGNPPASWLASAPKLRWVQLESVGFGEYADLDWGLLGRQVNVSNLKGFFTESVAESILAGILAHYRGIDRLVRLQESGAWMGDDLRPTLRTLRGAHVVLFGMGDINSRVAELLGPFDCRIDGFGHGWRDDELDRALSTAEIVICCAPHTNETRGTFDRRRVGVIRRGGLFVNFGRGSLVDESALADAVETGALAGAVIDVTREEPLPTEHRFWTCPGIILTQHTGGGSRDEVDRKIDIFLANLERHRRGEPPQGLVDFHRGY